MRLKLTTRVLATIVLALATQTAKAEVAPLEVQVMQTSATESEQLVGTEMSYDDRLATLESRLSMVESKPAPARSCKPCVTPSMRVSTNSIGCAANYAGFEFAILKPHVGGISGAIPPLGAAGSLTSTFDFDLAPRVYFGRERADGLGFRVTYFNLDDKSDASDLGVITGLELDTLDLEVTSRLKFCGSDLLLSSGFRYADWDQDYVIPGLGSLEFDSHGAGLTVGGQYTRDLGRTAWDLTISGRASILLTDNEFVVPGLISVVADESTMKIWEAKVGLSRTRELANGAQLVSQFAFETQNWDAAAIAGIIGNEFSLYGPTFRIGINR